MLRIHIKPNDGPILFEQRKQPLRGLNNQERIWRYEGSGPTERNAAAKRRVGLLQILAVSVEQQLSFFSEWHSAAVEGNKLWAVTLQLPDAGEILRVGE